MRTTAGIFQTRADAERAVERLLALGLKEERVSLLAPGTDAEEIAEAVPTTETEQPGLGKAFGGVAGGAIGAAGGLHLGAAVASLFVPVAGPIFAAGLIGAALLGAGGIATGVAAGGALEDNLAEGLPHDELFVYEDALRRGRTVVIAVGETDEQGEAARNALAEAGAESIDAAREEWWVGLRDAEAAQYDGGDFAADEPDFRRGFEASLHPKARGRSYEEADEFLHECFGADCERAPFRRGYVRGSEYHRVLQEKYRR
ncbi:MAG TPA: hypothetical protein VGV38_03035 [Pyrinomonadaceae bacterium]|nr:hypothetical protein [Pyrinomonadaceae bacterium]